MTGPALILAAFAGINTTLAMRQGSVREAAAQAGLALGFALAALVMAMHRREQ